MTNGNILRVRHLTNTRTPIAANTMLSADMVLALPMEMPMLNNGMTSPGVRIMNNKSSGSDTLS